MTMGPMPPDFRLMQDGRPNWHGFAFGEKAYWHPRNARFGEGQDIPSKIHVLIRSEETLSSTYAVECMIFGFEYHVSADKLKGHAPTIIPGRPINAN